MRSRAYSDPWVHIVPSRELHKSHNAFGAVKQRVSSLMAWFCGHAGYQCSAPGYFPLLVTGSPSTTYDISLSTRPDFRSVLAYKNHSTVT